MKPKTNGEMHKAELTSDELRLLVGYYDDALDETEKVQSPILKAQREANFARRDELERMFDARYWNRGKGRKPKAPADPGPELPMAPKQPEAVVNDIDA